MAEILTVYYSRKGENYYKNGLENLKKGNTEIAAELVQKAVGGDLFEIETVKPYADGYYDCCDEAKAELAANARPEIKAFADNIEQYDTLFICFPCWWGTYPMCVATFLEHYDLSGKAVYPLCTNEGSGMGNSERDLKKLCRAAVGKGLDIRGHLAAQSENAIAKWAKEAVSRS